ncbi:hypothetical protein Glove_117g519 [Diversispora epigaea]|uniref:Uncharacterized protein n=1 Tax=Diversispora epigaea TaxID=1348612 RepID=A0A397J4J5_9GLOM|nr:hypothetical protein Glove_117g519 [Diversispora epigaea]
MEIDILEFAHLAENEKEALKALKNMVDVHSIACKAEGEREIANATIINYEMAEILENKPKKILEEMQALKRFRISECYRLPSESLTEEFITDYGVYDEMKWFRNLWKLRDAGTNNGTIHVVKTNLALTQLLKFQFSIASDSTNCVNH